MDAVAKWSEEEQMQLENSLKLFPKDKFSPLGRYVKISALFPNKTIRDVALRVKWTSKLEEKKKKKGQDSSGKKKGPRDGKHAQWQKSNAVMGIKDQSIMNYAAYKPITDALDKNLPMIKQIQQNMLQNKVHENTELLKQIRDGIYRASNLMNESTGMMKNMPPLPAQINTHLAASLLERPI